MSEEQETPVDWRARLIEVFDECNHDIDFGQSGDDAIDIIHHIIKLRKERDAARAEMAKLRGILATLLDAFGTPATRETEVDLATALSGYEAAGMKDEAHVLRVTIEAINAVLGSEVGE